MTLKKAAEVYQQETGFDPIQYKSAVQAGAQHQGRANALLADLDWYHRHTQDVARRVSRAINKAL